MSIHKNNDPNNELMDLIVMQVLEMAMHATVEMLMINSSQPSLENVTVHASAIKIISVAARGVCKYMILDSLEIKTLTIPNIQNLQLKAQG